MKAGPAATAAPHIVFEKQIRFEEQIRVTLRQAQSARYDTLNIRDECLPFWVISHVRAGQVETRTGSETSEVRSGTVMVHPPNVPFSEKAAGPGTHEFLFLEAAVGAGVDLLRLHPVALTVCLTRPNDWSEIFGRLLRADGPASLSAFGLTVQLLGMILDDWAAAGSVPRPASLDTPADRFAGLVHYMHEHLSERIGREDLAAQMCLHPGSLNRAFRLAYGVPPMRLLRDLRLAHARHLLEAGDDTLETVAERCGFDDAAYFSRAFHARYGLPPGRYRQRMREGVKSALDGYSSSLPAPSGLATMGTERPADAAGE